MALCAYRDGAVYVDVLRIDQHVRRAMIELAPEDRVSWTPPRLLQRLEEHVGLRAAHVAITGEAEPELTADLDPARVGRARTHELNAANMRRFTGHALNWTLVAYPTAGWAETVFGEPDVERLWGAVAYAVRLDEPDPAAASEEHLAALDRRADALNERRFDAIRLEVRFEAGRAVHVGAASGAEALRAHTATDGGGSLLGELALVDGDSRVRRTGLTFSTPLFDENAACHLAYGQGIRSCVDGDPSAVNQPAVHVDFMVGSSEVEVDGLLAGGEAAPLLREDAWQLR